MIRISIAGVSVLLAVITVVGLNLFLKGGETAGMLLVNKSSNEFVGISEQACMWVFFYLGLGELILRFLESGREERQVRRKLLPEDERVVLTSKEIPALYERSKKAGDSYLPRLIMRITRQFQASKSAAQANSVLDSSLDLFLHEIDLKYNLLRYIMWVIPTVGFIGTVRGIALGLSSAAAESKSLAISRENMLLPLPPSRPAISGCFSLSASISTQSETPCWLGWKASSTKHSPCVGGFSRLGCQLWESSSQ